MPSQPDLSIKNYNIRQTVTTNAQLKPVSQFIITYNVGDFGPFTYTFNDSPPTPQQIKECIEKTVCDIRATLELLK